MILKAEDVRGQVLDHLGLVASVINRLRLVEKIDARIPVSKEKGAKVTMGQRVAAMILNGLGFTDDRLYLFPDFLKNKPVERLLGEGLKASDFNDDITGRCLDEITDYGTTPFFTEIAFEIGLAEKLLGPSAHFDTTSLNVFGEYHVSSSDEEKTASPFTITHGHSKDHRPDLKQMILNLATTGSGFPIWMEAHSGNVSDKTILEGGASRMRAFCNQLKSAPSFLYVGDSAFYERCVKENVAFKWLSRVPERLNETKKWVEMVLDYLKQVRSLKAINNHEVKDSQGNKTGQMPLTIQIGKDLIDQILEEDTERNQVLLTRQETKSLYRLREALDSLPISMNFQSLWSAVMEVDSIQKELMESVTVYLANISQFGEHELSLKAVVLVLKILEYDLSKKPGPITYGYGFFKLEVLSNEQRIENHGRVKKLLAEIIERFDMYYEQESAGLTV